MHDRDKTILNFFKKDIIYNCLKYLARDAKKRNSNFNPIIKVKFSINNDSFAKYIGGSIKFFNFFKVNADKIVKRG